MCVAPVGFQISACGGGGDCGGGGETTLNSLLNQAQHEMQSPVGRAKGRLWQIAVWMKKKKKKPNDVFFFLHLFICDEDAALPTKKFSIHWLKCFLRLNFAMHQ